MTEARRLPAGLLALALLAFALLAARFWFLTDDAYISFRYARHLVEGHGLVWNVARGGAPPVEGYSNLAWVLALAGTSALGIAPELASRALSVAAAVALLGLFARHLLSLPVRSRVAAGGAVLFLATLPPFAVWASGGLETMAFALALFGAHAALAPGGSGRAGGRRRVVAAAAAGALAVLLRADGLPWVLLVLAAGALDPPPGDGARGPGWRRRGLVAAVALAAAGAQVVFRLSVYGDWLPNSVRAKVSWSELDGELRARFLERGADYLVANALAVPSLLLALGVGIAGALRARSAAAVVAGSCAYCVAVGGDFMAMGRFLVPALPFLAVLFARGLERLDRRPALAGGLAGAAVALSVAAAFDVSPFPRGLRDRFHFRWNDPTGAVSEVEMWRAMRARTEQLVRLGRALGIHAGGPEEVATYGPVGAVGYHSRHTIHDTYGLTSRALLERSALGDELRSPGHDRRVPPEFLRELDLTYLEAAIEPAETPPPPLPPGAPWRWEEHPLDPAAGFEPGTVLRILRP